MALPIALVHGPGMRPGRLQGWSRHLLERHAEVALRADREFRHPANTAGRRPRDLDDGSGLVRPQRRRRCARRRRVSLQGRRQAGARAIHARSGHGVGPEGVRLRSTRCVRRSTPQGNVIAYDFLSKGFSRIDVDTNGSQPKDTLAGQTLGVELHSGDGFGIPGDSYGFANKRTAWETIAPLLDRASPLRSCAYARSGRAADPFRQRIVHRRIGGCAQSRSGGVPAALRAATRATSPSSRRRRKRPAGKRGRRRAPIRRGDKVTGRGISYAQRGATRVAIIAEVDVDRSTGKIWARKFTVAHDCGLMINPERLRITPSRTTSFRPPAAPCGRRSSSTKNR